MGLINLFKRKFPIKKDRYGNHIKPLGKTKSYIVQFDVNASIQECKDFMKKHKQYKPFEEGMSQAHAEYITADANDPCDSQDGIDINFVIDDKGKTEGDIIADSEEIVAQLSEWVIENLNK